MRFSLKVLQLCSLIGAIYLWGCKQTEAPHSHIWLRCETTNWQRSADWEFQDKGNGRYVLYQKDLFLDFLVDVKSAGKWNLLIWGANSNDSIIQPNATYQLGRTFGKFIQCGYNIIHCDSIVLITSSNKRDATITLHTSQPVQEFTLLNDTTTRPVTIHYRELNAKLQVLAVGNSLSGYNKQDSMFNAIARQSGLNATMTNGCKQKASLETLWNQSICSNINESAWWLIFSRSWTHIVLQDLSLRPLYDPEGFAESVHKWVNFIRNHTPNRDADIMLVMNWPKAMLWKDYTKIHKFIAHNSRVVANREGITLCPVGNAYTVLFETAGYDTAKALYIDDRHPSVAASYLAACMKYAQITNTSPTDIHWQPIELTPDVAKQMRLLAAQALQKAP